MNWIKAKCVDSNENEAIVTEGEVYEIRALDETFVEVKGLKRLGRYKHWAKARFEPLACAEAPASAGPEDVDADGRPVNPPEPSPDPVGQRCERGCGTPVNFGHRVCSPCLTKTLAETFRAQHASNDTPCQGDGRKACENAASSSGACAVHDPAIDETLGYIKPRSVAGLPVHVEPTLPPSVVEFRDESGRILGTLTGVPGWGEARVERREIAVEPSGFRKNDAGKLPLDLLSRVPLAVVVEVGQAFDFGGRKYGFANYRKGTAWSRYSAAGLRHLLAWMRGEELDLCPEHNGNRPEGCTKCSGLSHLAHAIACLMILRELQLDNLGTDDRVVVK